MNSNSDDMAKFDERKFLTELKELTSLVALSGYEDPVITYIAEKMEPLVEDLEVDTLGNVVVQVNRVKDKDPYRVLFFAHMDELGFVVKKVEEDGFLRLERLGGIPEKSMAGQTLLIRSENELLPGVVGTRSHHLTGSEDKYRVLPVKEAYADFGFRSKKEAAEAGVYPGTPVGYARQFFNNGSMIFGNALDNRAGCLVLMELIRKIKKSYQDLPVEVHVVFSVQEEFNLRGILPAVRNINPDLAVAIDLIASGDTPELQGSSDISLGGGPCVNRFSFHGRGTLGGLIPNPKLVEHVLDVARDNEIPVQYGVFMGGLTDASFSQLENDGIPMIDLAFPARYTHAPVEAADLNDIFQLILLLEKLLPTFKDLDLSRGR